MKILIREIRFRSDEYFLEVDLRSKILREPLGLKFSSEELDRESDQIHLGAFLEDELVGCLILAPQSEKVMKMRQVAVRTNRQGLGIGKALVAFSENLALEQGYFEMIMHAREAAVSFYERLGYGIVGDPLVEVTILHRKMKKELKNT